MARAWSVPRKRRPPKASRQGVDRLQVRFKERDRSVTSITAQHVGQILRGPSDRREILGGGVRFLWSDKPQAQQSGPMVHFFPHGSAIRIRNNSWRRSLDKT